MSILLIGVVIAFTYILTSEKFLHFLVEKYLKEQGIYYKNIEGTLFGGATLIELKYEDFLSIKKVEVDYHLLMLLTPIPRLLELKTDGLLLDIDKFLATDTTLITSIPFNISQVELKNTELIISDKVYKFDLNGSELHYNNNFEIEKVSLNLHTFFGDVIIKEGALASNALKGKATLELNQKMIKEYFGAFKGLPKILDVQLDANMQRIKAITKGLNLTLAADKNISIKNGELELNYFIEDGYFSASSAYFLSYNEYEAALTQSALFCVNGAYTTNLAAKLQKHPIALPFKNVSAEIAGDAQGIVANFTANALKLDFRSKDYKNFLIDAKAKEFSLSFLETLPDVVKKNIIHLQGSALLKTSPFALSGAVQSKGLYSSEKTSFEINAKGAQYQAEIIPKAESEIFKKYPMSHFRKISLVLLDDYHSQTLNINANLLSATLQKKGEKITGWGNISSSRFDISGDFKEKEETHIKLFAKLPSLKKLLHDFGVSGEDRYRFSDGAIDLNATVNIADKITIESDIHMPWYMLKLDAQTTYSASNVYMKLKSLESEVTVQSYSFEFMKHKIYSNRASKLLLDANQNIRFQEFWIYDNLLLSGFLNPKKMEGDLNLKSEGFAYASSEGNVTAKGDISAKFYADGSQKIEGEITLLEGVVFYKPATDFAVLDSDIIILQEIKEKAKQNRFVNIHINAAKPIAYKTKEIDLFFSPDITLFQEPQKELKVFGMVGIIDGKVIGSDKTFEFDKSEIYFNGETPINPQLNLNMHYFTLDYIDIEIYVSNTLNAPVLIFSSKPAMSQNDIMSYILFGESASSVFEGADEGNKLSISTLVLGTGLKQIFNSATSVKVDTLNILTNKEGTLGYEIGSRFNKQIRVVYKNDTISSVIVQYSLNKSLRVDVDVHETGQGVSIIYIKDF